MVVLIKGLKKVTSRTPKEDVCPSFKLALL